MLGAESSGGGNRMMREVVSGSDLADREYLTLKVIRHSQELEIHFRVKRTTMVRISSVRPITSHLSFRCSNSRGVTVTELE